MDTILFFKPSNSSFIKQDEEFLQKKFQVKGFTYPAGNLLQNLRSLIEQLIFLVMNINRCSLIYIWFADYHAFLPLVFSNVFGKKSILIIGGYDAADLKEYNYGAHTNPLRSWIIKQCCELTTLILPVSSFVLKSLIKLIEKAHVLKTRIVYNGADTNTYSINYLIEKQGVICISGANNLKRIKIKGLDFFAELAKNMPYINFTLVGVSGLAKDHIEKLGIENLKLIEWVGKEALTELLNRSKVICQFSRFESFGLALTEGMLCGCIPVTVKNIGPEEIVSEEVGVVIPSLDVDKATAAIKAALNFPPDASNRARLRVMSCFSLRKREETILKIIEELKIKKNDI